MRSPKPDLVAALFACLALVAAAARAQAPALEDNMCVMCHGESALWDEDTKHLFVTADDLSTDIHWQKGVRCQDCHGGNATATELRAAHAIEDGFRKVESPADLPDFCGHCHSDKQYMQKHQADADVNLVSDFWKSVHGTHLKANPADSRAASCLSCHPRHKTRAKADPESAVHPAHLLETCGTCHQPQRDGLLTGVHKEAEDDGKGKKSPLDCSQCHSDNVHGMRPVQDLESPVFVNHQTRSCGRCHEKPLEEYLVSVHGHGLQHAGLLSTAVCASCHGAHEIFPASDSRSSLHASRVAKTCAACHRYIEERLASSVHGSGNGPGEGTEKPAPGGQVKRRPSCTDCHEGHDLPHPKTAAFRVQESDRCGNCHTDLRRRYAFSLHGQLTQLGNEAAAKCSDCHGAHEILPVRDSESRLSQQNRLGTCRQCHPQAPAKMLSFDPHADHRDAKRSPLLHYTYLAMETLLYSVFGFFGIHTGLWFLRSWRHRWRQGAAGRLVAGRAAYLRFEPIHRLLHLVVIVSFLGLALTGLPLRYSEEPWAKWLASALGGFDNTSLLHRLCALLTVFYFGTHLVWLVRKVFQCRSQRMTWRELLLGPDSPAPGPRDFKDLLAMFRWLIGGGPRPTYERWTYWEKFDYWAVFWGVAIIGISGLMLWFPHVFCRFLPGWTLNIAKVIHSEEALLATGFIFAIHFFNTHLRAERFPMDMGMLTGLVSEEELEEERPEFVQRMRAAGVLDSLRTTVPANSTLWSLMLSGFVALAIGLMLLAGMIRAFFF